jgi:hypothetical protein
MRILMMVMLTVMMAVPLYAASNKKPYRHVYKQHEAVARARAAQIKQETADDHADAVQTRRHREQNQLQRQVYRQQELSRRQRAYSQEQKVQQQRTRRQNETRILGW